MTKKREHGKQRGGVGIGITDEGDDYQPISSFKNISSRIPRNRLQETKQCCTFTDECIIDDDFIVGDCD